MPKQFTQITHCFSKLMTLSHGRPYGTTCTAFVCLPPCSKLFKICTQKMHTLLWMDLSVFVPCPHEESNRAVLCPLCYFHLILIPLWRVWKECSLALATYGSPTCSIQMTCALLQIGQTKLKPCSIVQPPMPRGKGYPSMLPSLKLCIITPLH